MNKITRWLAGGISAILVTTGLVLVPVMGASAHTPNITATCSGVVLKASSYDASKANKWTATIGSTSQSGTFGSSLSLTLPVPQEGATTSWSATIQAEDGTYTLTQGGSIGPCGPTTIYLPTLGVTPGTCSTPGSLNPDFTKWPAAQNANGYEGDGFRIYLDKPYTGPGTYVATLQKVGPGFDPKYPNGTKVVGETKQTLYVQAHLSDEFCAGDQPDAKVTYTDWQDEAFTCADLFVTQTRTKTTTPYIRVGQKWVEDTANATTVTETQRRDKTDAEQLPCNQPPTLGTVTDWVDGKYACGVTEVTQTRSVTATSWMFDGTKWVPDTANAVTTKETQTRKLTASEQAENKCPITTVVEELAYTGSSVDVVKVGSWALLLIFIGVIVFLVARLLGYLRERRQH